MKVVPGKNGFFACTGLGMDTKNFLSSTVPSKLRYFENSVWYVFHTYLMDTVQMAYCEQGFVDYSQLPEAIQMQIATRKADWTVRQKKPSITIQQNAGRIEDYNTLHLTPSAPGYILDAVWKMIIRKCHPDKGGDTEKFTQYKDAYERIKGKV